MTTAPSTQSKPTTAAAPAPQKAKNQKKQKVRLPILVELTLSLSWFIVLFTGIAVTVISFLSGCDELETLIRALTSILVTGSLFFGLAWLITHGSLEVAKQMAEKAQEEAKAAREAEEEAARAAAEEAAAKKAAEIAKLGLDSGLNIEENFIPAENVNQG